MYIFLIIFLLHISLIDAKSIKKVVTISVIEEQINGDTFVHRVDVIDGKKREQWAIDGKSVDHDTYIEHIIEAEKEELKRERLKQEEEDAKQRDFQIEMQHCLSKKMLSIVLKKIEKYLKKIDKYKLEQYIRYDSRSIPSEKEFDLVRHEYIPQVKNILNQSSNEVQLSQIKEMNELLNEYPERLHILFQDAIRNACDQSDDTKLLKELLELVSDSY